MIARAALATLMMLVPQPAGAEACPADAEGSAFAVTGPSGNVGVSTEVLTLVPTAGAPGRAGTARLMRLTVAPGGHVGLHSHEALPGMAYVLAGTAVETRSDCARPIARAAGDIVREHTALTHTLTVTGDEPFVALVTHVIQDPEDG